MSRFVFIVFFASILAIAAEKTTVDGVYSAEQAKRGQAAYGAKCAACHAEDLTAYRGALKGAAFVENFQGDSLRSLFDVTKKTMPRDSPSSLTDDMYLDIIAYVLKVNGYPSANDALNIEALRSIKLVALTGSERLPNFSLIEVVGCMTLGEGSVWTLTRATVPMKTRDPNASNDVDLKVASAKPLGKLTFRVEDVSYFKPEAHEDQKMLAKGFLMRQRDGDRISITSLQMVAATCAK